MYPAERPRVGQICAALLLLAAVGLLIPCSGCAPVVGEQPELANTTHPPAVSPEDPFAEATDPPPVAEPNPFSQPDKPRAVQWQPPPGGVDYMPSKLPSQHRGSGRKYRKLLQKIEVEGDQTTYGEFNDWGYWSGTSYRGHKDLPPGYWVYVTPCWYIFGESDETPPPVEPPPVAKRSWGPEQATGEPDTLQAGDRSTAWASKTADGQDEWLRLRYRRAVTPTAVHVYESYNPGALYRITARNSSGREIEIWSGEDPIPVGSGIGQAAIPVATSFKTDCITIYLRSSTVKSWNEIDAVGLLDSSENVQWAVSATASSSYADLTPPPPTPPPTPQSNRQRIEKLETEVRRLRTELNLVRTDSDSPASVPQMGPLTALTTGGLEIAK